MKNKVGGGDWKNRCSDEPKVGNSVTLSALGVPALFLLYYLRLSVMQYLVGDSDFCLSVVPSWKALTLWKTWTVLKAIMKYRQCVLVTSKCDGLTTTRLKTGPAGWQREQYHNVLCRRLLVRYSKEMTTPASLLLRGMSSCWKYWSKLIVRVDLFIYLFIYEFVD